MAPVQASAISKFFFDVILIVNSLKTWGFDPPLHYVKVLEAVYNACMKFNIDWGIDYEGLMRLIARILKKITFIDLWLYLPDVGVTCVGAQVPTTLLGKLIISLGLLFVSARVTRSDDC